MIFRSLRDPDGALGYDDAADRMDALARTMPGYLGHHSARGIDGVGITVSYWASRADIARWRAHPEHAAVIAAARERLDGGGWYASYVSETAVVERVSRSARRDEEGPGIAAGAFECSSVGPEA